MQDAHVAAFRLQLTNQRHHAAETARTAVFDSTDAVGIVQMYERDTGNLR